MFLSSVYVPVHVSDEGSDRRVKTFTCLLNIREKQSDNRWWKCVNLKGGEIVCDMKSKIV